jgi:hypothetical protein
LLEPARFQGGERAGEARTLEGIIKILASDPCGFYARNKNAISDATEEGSPEMKRTLFSLLAVIALTVVVGCASDACRRPCSNQPCVNADQDENASPQKASCCDKLRAFFAKEDYSRQKSAVAENPSSVGYPYYTTRGPRDFYAKQYQNIGP